MAYLQSEFNNLKVRLAHEKIKNQDQDNNQYFLNQIQLFYLKHSEIIEQQKPYIVTEQFYTTPMEKNNKPSEDLLNSLKNSSIIMEKEVESPKSQQNLNISILDDDKIDSQFQQTENKNVGNENLQQMDKEQAKYRSSENKTPYKVLTYEEIIEQQRKSKILKSESEVDYDESEQEIDFEDEETKNLTENNKKSFQNINQDLVQQQQKQKQQQLNGQLILNNLNADENQDNTIKVLKYQFLKHTMSFNNLRLCRFCEQNYFQEKSFTLFYNEQQFIFKFVII
ncbi:hypothetical protein PPERSA_07435 [Pseudocohnilembus persalinus]|uniref:Uncharacterized protein n=1 Tax=Pseudocohnilembus persalinus TaxID=266149 RepID=A0A0V0QAF5_PSEPJ|nr:hypothetical protein PPERSA_07435 [Pseudocohnilembus persalinus]|eukprot:KRW99192.1 hypothetical protein PPERSA_07435 [Pseudocohnilembus persalinus]